MLLQSKKFLALYKNSAIYTSRTNYMNERFCFYFINFNMEVKTLSSFSFETFISQNTEQL